MKKLILLLLALIMATSSLSLMACGGKYADATVDAVYTVEDAAKEIAYAYYRQEKQLNYNQTMSRRNINVSPEEATSQHMLFIDCSSYVNAVIKEAFGINILPYETTEKSPNTANYFEYAITNVDSDDVVGVWKRADYSFSEDETVMNTVKGLLKVGDILNYRKADTGHALIYVGEGQFLHSTGDDFNDDSLNPEKSSEGFNQSEPNGTVKLDSWDIVFDKEGERYVFKENYTGFCILRPTARGVQVTEETHARMLSKGLDGEKTSDIGVNTSLAVGDKITYTVTVENHRDLGYKEVEVKDVLDDNLEFVSGSKGVSCDGQNVTFKKNVKAGKSFTISWTAKVKDSVKPGTVIVSDKTTVNGVGQAIIKNSVSKYSSAQLEQVASKAKEYASQGKTFADPIDMVKQLYKDALNVNLFDYEDIALALDDVFESESAELKETDIVSIIAPDMYGGQTKRAVYTSDKDIIRLITTDNLSVGDVIIAEKNARFDNSVAYVYVGGKQVVSCTTKDKGEVKLLTMADSQYDSAHVLVTIFAYNRYAVLRPSMAE